MAAWNPRESVCIALSLVALIAMLTVGARPTADAGRDQAYLTAVSDAIASIPYRIGPWIGKDMEPQAPAIELLKPNHLLQRRYVRSDGSTMFSLLFVHCSDARDMQGHYPPICYPAQGWVISSSEQRSFRLGSTTVPAVVYQLTGIRSHQERRMTILNFFVVPSDSEPFTPDMSGVNRASAASARSFLGAAQVQLILHEQVPAERITTLMEELAPAIEPAVRKVIDERSAESK